MIAMLLAAGRGERMQPLTRSLAKPAIPLLGEAMVVHGLRALAATGAEEAVVNLHHRPDDVVAALAGASGAGLRRVHYSREIEALLGTGGGLRHAAGLLRGSGTVAVRNGDFLADVDAPSALAAHRASKLPATLVLTAPRPGFTSVPVSADGKVLGFGDGPDVPAERVAARYTFTGLHFLEESLLDRLPEGRSDLVPALYGPLAAEGRLGAFVHHGFWWEFGTPAAFLDGALRLLDLRDDERRAVLRHDPVLRPGGVPVAAGRGARWDDGVRWVGAAAVGAGCRIDRAARIERTVLLPGVQVGSRAVLRDCLVGPGVSIAPGSRFDSAMICRADDGPAPPGTTRAQDLWIRSIDREAR